MVTVSIVSHGHGEMVNRLIAQLLDCPEISRIVLTKNIPEVLLLPASPKIHVITNKSPKGFGENHNFAFSKMGDEFFCPLNPDIRLLENPFPRLIEVQKKYGAGLIAPIVLSNLGILEDSARHFPTLISLGKKFLFKNQGRWNFDKNAGIFSPEWIAGMFMFFKSSVYKELNGFDEKFFLYYEDVDICARLWRGGMGLLVDPSVIVIHDARRTSRHNVLYMILHLKSMGRYFSRYFMRLPKIKPYKKND